MEYLHHIFEQCDPAELAEILAGKLRLQSESCAYYGQNHMRRFLDERAADVVVIKAQIMHMQSQIEELKKPRPTWWQRIIGWVT